MCFKCAENNPGLETKGIIECFEEFCKNIKNPESSSKKNDINLELIEFVQIK